MLPHGIHDLLSSTLSCRTRRFGGHRQWVNQRLGVMLPHVGQKAVDIPANIDAGRLNSCYDLFIPGKDLFENHGAIFQAYLWDDFKPSVHLHTGEPGRHSVTDFVMSSVFEP